MPSLRIVTYNVHRCRGIDNRERPARIVDVLREIDADVIALQEVLSIPGAAREKDQARFIAEELGLNHEAGENRKLNGGSYGNVVLSRFPMRLVRNHDISVRARERRGCLHTDVDVAGADTVHVFNVHLGTAYLERRHQGRRLVEEEILSNRELKGARIMLGDFNEWTRGLTTRLMRAHLKSVDVKNYLQRAKTFPGFLPVLHLDHIYFEDKLELKGLTVHRTRKALVASDHLPLVANFALPAAERALLNP
jgi:endonuclease/exonuclease/phosphatase family metal-dependent hydrolase